MGKTLGEGSKSKLEMVNDWLGSATGFADAHPGLSTSAILGGAGAAGWGVWKSGAAIWKALTGGGSAAGAWAAASGGASSLQFPTLEAGPATAGAGWLGKILSAGSVAMGPLMMLEALTQPSPGDIAALKYRDVLDATDGKGYRGKGFDDPRRLDAAPAQNASVDAISMMSETITRLEAIANRPVVVTLDGKVLADSLNHQNSKDFRRF